MSDVAPLDADRGELTEEVLVGPPGFDEFWRGMHAAAIAVEPAVRRVREISREPGWRLSEVRFTSIGGLDLGAFLLEPDGGVERLVLGLPGYGGASESFDPLRRPGVAELTLVPRGMPALSEQPGIPNAAAEHVLHGIASREDYVIGGCVQDVWVATTAAQSLFPGAGRVDLRGGSFGGGLGALALPWDDRFTAAALTVPTFGNHPARLRTPCTGSGESVRLLAQRDPRVIDVVRYFDAATAAARVRVPVLVGAARVDPAVPPVGQFAVYEALAGQRSLVELTAGHLEFDGAEREGQTFHGATLGWLSL